MQRTRPSHAHEITKWPIVDKQRTNNGEACKASRVHPADMDRGANEASGAHPTETTLTGLADAVMLVDQFG